MGAVLKIIPARRPSFAHVLLVRTPPRAAKHLAGTRRPPPPPPHRIGLGCVALAKVAAIRNARAEKTLPAVSKSAGRNARSTQNKRKRTGAGQGFGTCPGIRPRPCIGTRTRWKRFGPGCVGNRTGHVFMPLLLPRHIIRVPIAGSPTKHPDFHNHEHPEL